MTSVLSALDQNADCLASGPRSGPDFGPWQGQHVPGMLPPWSSGPGTWHSPTLQTAGATPERLHQGARQVPDGPFPRPHTSDPMDGELPTPPAASCPQLSSPGTFLPPPPRSPPTSSDLNSVSGFAFFSTALSQCCPNPAWQSPNSDGQQFRSAASCPGSSQRLASRVLQK